ncbi:PREDICTED: uncharacterized protein LOC106344753 [Brassica oleracea var. oleracea]|uniref:uncharacterized protein LOC106344753 n=1 Tax=Brassica oleracea var. oleracea TaxID=109376 RepID=UPI0006A73834|nr:PREDICTED: uncharacterized protein LOC106344753 [Brassica oleracea var. oleracea]
MAKPGNGVPSKIRESTRFYPFFQDCIGAIDGTHIPAMVVGNETASYRNRKGVLSQNVLAACNFDLQFIYVLTGWEGSAHDAKVLNDALTRSNNKFEIPEEETYEEQNVTQPSTDGHQFLGTQEQQREHANEWRTTIATNMWNDAVISGSQRCEMVYVNVAAE